LDPTNVFYFNEENIDKVVFEGFKDEEERNRKIYSDWKEESKANIKKGIVTASLE